MLESRAWKSGTSSHGCNESEDYTEANQLVWPNAWMALPTAPNLRRPHGDPEGSADAILN